MPTASPNTALPRPWPLLVAAALGLALALWAISRPREAPDSHLRRRIDAIDWSAPGPQASNLLVDADPRLRAAACRALAAAGSPDAAPLLVPRASDTDWRVRAAAFEGLRRIGPPLDPPLRDTPLAAREQVLLDWLDTRAAPSGAPLASRLCDLYANTGPVEFGRPLAARCLHCHAGPDPKPFAEADACAACHADVHAQWAASAHAQSLTHLRLATVNPRTRKPEPMDFGDVRGIHCFACHRPDAAAHANAPRQDPAETCPHAFDTDRTPHNACAECHTDTHRQWTQWLKGPQPRMADWPPGQLDAAFTGDRRSCADCHMPPADPEARSPRTRHDWSARRNTALLAKGVHIHASPERGPDGTALRLTLTNLSGHAFPAGSSRRAVHLYAAAGAEPEQWVAALTRARRAPAPGMNHAATADAPDPDARQPPLAPGEQRTLLVNLPDGAAGWAFRLVYVRYAANPDAYAVEFISRKTGTPF